MQGDCAAAGYAHLWSRQQGLSIFKNFKRIGGSDRHDPSDTSA
jgi:hypothetical protein